MSSGSESGHQSRLVRPSSERTVVGRSTGQPPISPVFASMARGPPDRLVQEAPRPGRSTKETIKLGQSDAENRLVHVAQADPQIIVSGDQRERGRGPEAAQADGMDPRLAGERAPQNQRPECDQLESRLPLGE